MTPRLTASKGNYPPRSHKYTVKLTDLHHAELGEIELLNDDVGSVHGSLVQHEAEQSATSDRDNPGHQRRDGQLWGLRHLFLCQWHLNASIIVVNVSDERAIHGYGDETTSPR